jgi:phosphoribosylamine---glycine ligase
MNILLLGSGGREHALAWKLTRSPFLDTLFIMPGNPGTGILGVNLPGNPLDFDRVREVVLQTDVSMVVVGPEEPLVKGIHDFFLSDPLLSSVRVIGPVAAGARLEGSKAYAKEFMVRHGIPTAAYKVFSSGEVDEAIAFLSDLNPPYVLKADGLAAGKGVVIHHDVEAARHDIHDMLIGGRFGQAGSTLVIEEFLSGIEVSVFVMTDGRNYVVLPEAKDYKRIGEGDTGPNTGGMGSLSPVPFFDNVLLHKVEQQIIIPTIRGLEQDNTPYSGFIFFGLMIVNGNPFVIEYNVRMGDPETESVLPRVENDLVELFLAVGDRALDKHCVKISPGHVATVMLVSEGYPGDYEKGYAIHLPAETGSSLVFHAGTRFDGEQLVTNGGRVLAITSSDDTLQSAIATSCALAEKVSFQGKVYRKDLGFDL